MVVSEIEYQIVLLFCIEEYFEPEMEDELSIIVPDVISEYNGSVLEMKVNRDYLYVHFRSSPDHSPSEVARGLALLTSARLINLHNGLKGYETVFRPDFCVKTGEKMGEYEIEDFMAIAKSRL
ncbi:MAG: transposase [Nitrospinota bacterium]|nr:transposase [Nitrospinota bacterium]